MTLTGQVYRAHHPRWSFAPVSGDGAAQHGGRFNPPGMPALYTSLRMETAWREAQQAFPFKAQPMTVCMYDVDCSKVADLTAPATCSDLGIDAAALGCGWEDIVDRGQIPPTWTIARRLVGSGFRAIIVPSFAANAPDTDRNVVFWAWSPGPPCSVNVVDDARHLPRNDLSWDDPRD